MKEMRKKGRGREEIPLFFSLSLYSHLPPPSTPATQATPTDTLGFLVSFYILVSYKGFFGSPI